MFGWGNESAGMSNALSIVELLVNMDCEGCAKRVHRAISKLDGVDAIEIDMEKQKVTVTGYVDRQRVLEVVRRARHEAEFWPFQWDDVVGDRYYTPYDYRYHDERTPGSRYNYGMHGYNQGMHGSTATTTLLDDHVVHLFSDDNVNAYCTIM